MEQKNEMMITFDSRSSNESFARVAVAAFTTQLNPTLEEVADIKTAISEAITNAIIHGYEEDETKLKEYHFDTRVTYNKEIYTREQAMNLFGNLVRR